MGSLRRPDQFFLPRNVTNVILATVIVGVITFAVNFVLQLPTAFVPGLWFLTMPLAFIADVAIGVLFLFTTVAAVDRNLKAAVDAVKASFELVEALELLHGAAHCARDARHRDQRRDPCGLGLIVAIPLILLIQVYAWRRLSGGLVAALSQ